MSRYESERMLVRWQMANAEFRRHGRPFLVSWFTF
jgi:hypothetical protein